MCAPTMFSADDCVLNRIRSGLFPLSLFAILIHSFHSMKTSSYDDESLRECTALFDSVCH